MSELPCLSFPNIVNLPSPPPGDVGFEREKKSPLEVGEGRFIILEKLIHKR